MHHSSEIGHPLQLRKDSQSGVNKAGAVALVKNVCEILSTVIESPNIRPPERQPCINAGCRSEKLPEGKRYDV